MKYLHSLIVLLFGFVLPHLAYSDGSANSVTGPQVTVQTDGTLDVGAVNIATMSGGPINFFTNKVKRGYIDASTGALTGFTISGGAYSGTFDSLLGTATSSLLGLSTTDAADSKSLYVASGSAASIDGSRGSTLVLDGNEVATVGGSARLFAGNVSTATIDLDIEHSSSSVRIRDVTSGTLFTFSDAGNLTFGAAAAKVVPGATSLTFRNNADSADNLAIVDAGTATFRAGIVQAAGTGTPNLKGTTSLNADVTGFGRGTGQSSVFVQDGANQNVSLVAYDAGTGFGAYSGLLSFYKTRSTSATGDANTIVQSGDILGRIDFNGADGVVYRTAAAVIVTSDATPGAGDMPGALDFQLSPDGSATLASVLKLSNSKAAQFTGTVRSSATADIGWSVVTGADTACNTTCTSACVFGFNITAGVPGTLLACTDATADVCLCAGAS